MTKDKSTDTAFLSDVKTLRARARKQIEDGALTPAYALDPKQAIDLLCQMKLTPL